MGSPLFPSSVGRQTLLMPQSRSLRGSLPLLLGTVAAVALLLLIVLLTDRPHRHTLTSQFEAENMGGGSSAVSGSSADDDHALTSVYTAAIDDHGNSHHVTTPSYFDSAVSAAPYVEGVR